MQLSSLTKSCTGVHLGHTSTVLDVRPFVLRPSAGQGASPVFGGSLFYGQRLNTRMGVRARYQEEAHTAVSSSSLDEEEEHVDEEDSLAELGSSIRESHGTVVVRDDLDQLLTLLPQDIREPLITHPQRSNLLEVVLDLGRRPEARFLGIPAGEFLREAEVTAEDLQAAVAAVGEFGADNRAGVASTLHRISALRNRRGAIIGLTCRVGRAVSGHTDMLRDLVEGGHSVLLLGRPGVGKTTVIRELARVMADVQRRRVVIVDTSNEIGGDGDVPHPAIGGARRMQVPDPSQQDHIMIEAVENHMPQVVVVDEVGTEAEALACRTIAERGVQLVATAHGCRIENLIKNPTLADLIGGIQSVTLGDEEAKTRGTQKTILERKAPPTFPVIVEMRARGFYVAHWAQDSVDCLLLGRPPMVQVRERDPSVSSSSSPIAGVRITQVRYNAVPDPEATAGAGDGKAVWADDYEDALKSAWAQSGGEPGSEAWTRIKTGTAGAVAAARQHASDVTTPGVEGLGLRQRRGSGFVVSTTAGPAAAARAAAVAATSGKKPKKSKK